MTVEVQLAIGHPASMRPRVFPAEDCRSGSGRQCGRLASMRPRVFPAEDLLNNTYAFQPPKLQ